MKTFGRFLLLLLTACVGCEKSPPTQPPAPDKLQQLQQSLQTLQRQQDQTAEMLAEWIVQKDEVVLRLDDLGIHSSQDLPKNQRGKALVRELLEISRQVEVLRRRHQQCEDAVFRAESLERRLQRRLAMKQAGLEEEDLQELQTVAELAVELDIELDLETGGSTFSDLETQAILEKELRGD